MKKPMWVFAVIGLLLALAGPAAARFNRHGKHRHGLWSART